MRKSIALVVAVPLMAFLLGCEDSTPKKAPTENKTNLGTPSTPGSTTPKSDTKK